ncbi:ketoacyl-ACP synthase III family protein [Micromonospora sp. NPDC049900]|uniref:ketoacyl-ACP synthase III family protein n=1 Tax=Micromonospora sp. NPDC049900 TaxID=3364275 RepID=UPI0037931FC7
MRFDGVRVAGVAAYVPGRTRVRDAVADGRCSQRLATQTGLDAVSVSSDESGPELAVRAAELAVKRSGHTPDEVALLLHATVYHQGHDVWAPASYIQRMVLGNRCPALEVRQLSNGGLAALDLAAAYLTAAPRRAAALLTTGDRFCPPGFDRWNSDPGTVYGDAGTALVLSRHAGFARLLSLVTVSESDLEGLHRGDDPFGAAPLAQRQPVDLDAVKKAFVARTGVSYSISRVVAGQSEAVDRALAEAGLTFADVDRFVLPHFGLRRLTSSYLRPWQLDRAVTTWAWASTVGHLGAGDQFSGLAHLVESGTLRPGERVLLAGVGAGYTWTCAVLEIDEVPGWAG